MEHPLSGVSGVTSQITFKTDVGNSPKSVKVGDYFGEPDEAHLKSKSGISSAKKPAGKKPKDKKHVIDKCGPFAAKGREDGNLIMVGGKNGFGMFAKKIDKPV